MYVSIPKPFPCIKKLTDGKSSKLNWFSKTKNFSLRNTKRAC